MAHAGTTSNFDKTVGYVSNVLVSASCQAALDMGLEYLRFSMEVYKARLDKGRHFLHEHFG